MTQVDQKMIEKVNLENSYEPKIIFCGFYPYGCEDLVMLDNNREESLSKIKKRVVKRRREEKRVFFVREM